MQEKSCDILNMIKRLSKTRRILKYNMRIPILLENAIEKEIKGIKTNELKEIAKKLSDRYMNELRNGQTLLSQEKEEEFMV